MEIEIQNNNIDISLGNENTNINLDNEDYDIEISEEELEVEVDKKEINLELGAYSVPATDRNHSTLYNLDYEHSGHTGFQEEMQPLTNLEIEEMFRSYE